MSWAYIGSNEINFNNKIEGNKKGGRAQNKLCNPRCGIKVCMIKRLHGKQLLVKRKGPAIDKPFNFYLFTFFHLKIKKSPPYAINILVLVLPIDSNRCVKIFRLGMENWFQPKDRLIKVEHVGVTSPLLSWILEIDVNGLHQWVEENEDHIDLYVYS